MTGQPIRAVAFGHHMLHEVAMRDLVSSTYRATSLGPPAQAVAVRVVSSTLAATSGELDGFLRANSRVSTTDHPHALRVVDVGQLGEHAYVASVWRDGGPLADLLAARRQLPVWMVVRMAGELAEALDALHANGIVHGTVGMHSVWVKDRRRGQRASNVALTGFGTSHLLGAALHNAGHADAGADLLFVAPEQLRDGRTDAASDQYALACLLYTMLTGTPPFRAATNKELFAEHLRAVAPPVSSLRPELDDAWDTVIGRALDKDPAARYADCRTLLREVSRCAPPPDDARQTIAAWPNPRSSALGGDAHLSEAGGDAHLSEAGRSAHPSAAGVDAHPPAVGGDAHPPAVGGDAHPPAVGGDPYPSAAGPSVPARARRRGLRPLLIGVLVALVLAGLVLSGVPSPVDTGVIEWPAWLVGSDEQPRSGDAVR